ncbi:unnamed protein product [Parnassius apollo]|uniref:(apollo) hypothetical protein n=1 Tax=Parnassius apollo TaxID=110799 RepID=A0A8S3XK47_PARAO|nr:unnamed protein product [Parnassius apollo]
MDNVRKLEANNVAKKHFPKLHERIQNKYIEMQKKIEKSKSIDMLTSLNENFVYTEPRRYMSTSDIRNDTQENFDNIESGKKLVRKTLVIENMQENSAIYQDIYFNEAIVNESSLDIKQNGIFESEDNQSESIFFNDMSNSSKTSLESLLEIDKGSDESLPPPTPISRSLRDKIGSRIMAAKERRNASKEKRKEAREKVEKLIFTNTPDHDIERVLKRTEFATVTIALIEASGIENKTTEEKLRFLCCRLRLGTEKRKSKLVKTNDSVVKWQELINITMYDETQLELSVWDRDIVLGKTVVDLSLLKVEQTHRMRINLEGEGSHIQLFTLLTISGASLNNRLVDLDDYQKLKSLINLKRKKYAWYHLCGKFSDVGWLSVIVYGAKGLSTSDCYCILKLNNERLFTHTEHKTDAPNWMKIFTFTVTDITSILEVIIWDEKKFEEVGKLSIPIHKIKTLSKKWYALKGISQRDRAKGNNPRILLELDITWNLIKASVRVFNPKEVNLLQTEENVIDRRVFAKNITRAKAIISWIMNTFNIFKTMFEWESRRCNVIALATWLIFCWFFKIWMLPLLLLVPFALYKPSKNSILDIKKRFQEISVEDDNNSKHEKEEKNLTIRQKINSLQEMIQTVQNVIGKFASLGESVKNLFNFSVPFLSCLTIFLILIITLVMYFIPLKYMLMTWGIHKFTRKILQPNRIPNNELLDLLSRVPDDETLLSCEEFLVENLSDEDE